MMIVDHFDEIQTESDLNFEIYSDFIHALDLSHVSPRALSDCISYVLPFYRIYYII